MEPIILSRKAGGQISLQSREDNAPTTTTAARHRWELLGEDVIIIAIQSAKKLPFAIGDYTTIAGRKYYLNKLPTARKAASNRYEYDLELESIQYQLGKVQFFDTDAGGIYIRSDFYLTATLQQYAQIVVANMNRIHGAGAWALAHAAPSDHRPMAFDTDNCLSALQRICDEFGVEFTIDESSTPIQLTVKETGKNIGAPISPIKYGRGKGIYTLTRQNVNPENVTTRLYAFGSNRNIPPGYRDYSQRLMLPGLAYRQNGDLVAAIGIIEETAIWDDIYPQRTGTISAVGEIQAPDPGSIGEGQSSPGTITITDSALDFDINEQLMPGMTAKVHFLTGQMAGMDLEITKYVHSTKTMTLIRHRDGQGNTYPNTSGFTISPGDQYTLLDIIMPEAYITQAEQRLLTRALEHLSERSRPTVEYSLTIDEYWLRQRLTDMNQPAHYITPGDTIEVKDPDLGVDATIRIKAITRDLIRPHRYELYLSDTKIGAGIRKKIINDVRTIKHVHVWQPVDKPEAGRPGRDAQEIELRAENNTLEWKRERDEEFTQLIDLNPIKDKHLSYPIEHSKQATIYHGLGKNPAVQVTDENGEKVIADIEHIDVNTVKITASEYFTGRAYFN